MKKTPDQDSSRVLPQNITDIKSLEMQLLEPDGIFKTIFDNATDGILLADLEDKKLLLGNATICRMLGYTPEEIRSLHVMDIHPENDLPYVLSEFARQARGENTVAENIPVKRKDGSVFHAEITAAHLNIDGRSCQAGFFRDISGRNQREVELRITSDRLSEAERIGKLGFLDWNLITNEIEVSDETLRIYGLPLGKNKLKFEEITKRVHPDDVEYAVNSLHNAIEKGEKHDIEHRIVRTDGTVIYVHTPAEVLRNANGKPIKVLGTVHDITERKQAEAALRRLNDELEEKVMARTAALERAKLEVEQASRAKDEFLAAISHELKTPLNHILGFADLLKEGLAGELNAEQKGMAQDIFDAGNRQLAIVNSLIELARLQAGKVELRAKPEDPARMLGEIAARHAAKAKLAGLAFTVEVAESLGEMPLDRDVVTHLLDQLLANAFKFTPSGGKVSLAVRRVPRTNITAPVRSEAGEYLELAVTDNGPGIAPEFLPQLFQPFVQGNGHLNRRYQGTGIGLMLVRLLVELHGGGSGVESRPGAGAKFLVWLPIGKQ